MFTNRNSLPEVKKVVVVSPHPDDETIGCAGAICTHCEKGAEVTILFVTNGENGLPLQLRKENRSYRQEEAKQACEILGVKEYVWLGFEDGKLSKDIKKVKEVLACSIGNLSPELVYIPSYFEEHPDHLAVCSAMVECDSYYKGLVSLYEVWSPLRPNHIFNVSRFIEVKKAALAAYGSQEKQYRISKMALALNEYRGCRQPWVRPVFAEAFWTGTMEDLKSLYLQSYPIIVNRE